ncbi:MAG: putative sulfate exporter family transporter [Alphaproteobacteria bacterium]|nr:putative sulfate exporter family transporter [Alphaproteobacteria bacterium]
MNNSLFTRTRPFAFFILGAGCLFSNCPSDIALLLGVAFALVAGNPFDVLTRKAIKRLLAYSIIGLGAGMNLVVVAKVGLSGLEYTALGIGFALLAGRLLGKLFRTENDLSWLISFGTAICGGSAIAALAPVLHAKDHSISVALGVVFVLNAVALVAFPFIGHMLHMPEAQFGLWSALAIHDTSSVVGAGLQYGPEALAVGTTVKLARALWIVPLVFAIQAFESWRRTGAEGEAQEAVRPKIPWFILGFLLMAAVATWVPGVSEPADMIAFAAKRCLVLTLFLIGSTLTPHALRTVGFAPFLQGVSLWLLVSASSLTAILWIGVGV